MIMLNTKENLELVALPIEELKQLDKEKRQAGHYLLEKLDMNRFEISDETFDDPGVPRNIVVITQKPVGCRFIYDDEDEKEATKSWLKIKIIKPISK